MDPASTTTQETHPGDRVDQLRPLEVGDLVVEGVQGEWVPARLIVCRATDGKEQMWRCCRSYHLGVQEYERSFKME